jgi:hypothetical protein
LSVHGKVYFTTVLTHTNTHTQIHTHKGHSLLAFYDMLASVLVNACTCTWAYWHTYAHSNNTHSTQAHEQISDLRAQAAEAQVMVCTQPCLLAYVLLCGGLYVCAYSVAFIHLNAPTKYVCEVRHDLHASQPKLCVYINVCLCQYVCVCMTYMHPCTYLRTLTYEWVSSQEAATNLRRKSR